MQFITQHFVTELLFTKPFFTEFFITGLLATEPFVYWTPAIGVEPATST